MDHGRELVAIGYMARVVVIVTVPALAAATKNADLRLRGPCTLKVRKFRESCFGSRENHVQGDYMGYICDQNSCIQLQVMLYKGRKICQVKLDVMVIQEEWCASGTACDPAHTRGPEPETMPH